ncbi:MAG: sugar phosphate isomerase/epimerase [Clostridiales bacterium]|nr:sugar phosphate isomerase/epimerase [Clostridiales bacterium]
MNYPVSTSVHFRFDTDYKVPLNDQISRIIDGGFKYLDFNFLDWNADRRSPFVGPDWESWIDGAGELAAKRGVKFNQAHAPVYNGLRYEGCTQEDIHEFQLRAIRACAKLGISWMVYHAIYHDNTDDFSINHETFDPLLEEARRCGVGMAFENTWVTLQQYRLWRTEDLIELADSYNDPLVGICWDTGHCNVYGGIPELRKYTDQYNEIMKLGKRLKALHIDDNNGYVDDHIAPYDGVIDWNSVMRALRDAGYEHSFTFEAHNAVRRVPECLADERIAYMKRLGDTLVALV